MVFGIVALIFFLGGKNEQETSVAILRHLLSTYKPPSSLNLFDQADKGSLSYAGTNQFFDSLTSLRISHPISKMKSDPSEKRDISSECASGILLKHKLSISANQELIAIADSESVSICAADAFVQSDESFGQVLFLVLASSWDFFKPER